MTMHTSTGSSREIAHWRNFFRTRDSAVAHAQPPDRSSSEAGAADADGFATTEWAETQWSDTCIDVGILTDTSP